MPKEKVQHPQKRQLLVLNNIHTYIHTYIDTHVTHEHKQVQRPEQQQLRVLDLHQGWRHGHQSDLSRYRHYFRLRLEPPERFAGEALTH